MKHVSIIIPCYQNEGSIAILADRLIELQRRMETRVVFSYVLVNDGSTDNTYVELMAFKNKVPDKVRIVKMTRNFGSYNAFLAGMYHSEGDAHVHLHADLQDPPELIEEMFGYFEKGNRLVIAFRQNREDNNVFSSIYHWMVKKFAIKDIPPGGFDLILFDEQIKRDIIDISEKNTNIVYLISWLGYPYLAIPYKRRKREHGQSQWKFAKKVKLFVDTIFSFSELPIYFLRFFSVSSFLSGITLFIYSLVQLYHKISFITLILTFGLAFVLMTLGIAIVIFGEYINRIHETVRKRPNFVVDEVKN